MKRMSLLILVVMLVVSVSGCVTLNNTGEEPTMVGSNTNAQATQAPTQTPKQFKVGEIASLKDILVTFVGATESKGSEYNKPAEGNVFLICEFDIENKSDKEITVSSMLSFEAYVDDYSTDLSISGLIEKGNKQQLDGSIAAGKKMNGIIAYEVPSSYKEIEIKFSPDVWAGSDITFVKTK